MSRTITVIYNEIITEKETMESLDSLLPSVDSSQTLLADLTSTSKVAIWRLMFFVVAVAIWTHEKIFDLHKAEIEARALEIKVGNVPWYRDQCFAFQYGDVLEWINDKYRYSIIDESKKIIQRASVIEAFGQVRIKVAKISAGLPVALSTSELTAFKSYLNKVKFAGTNIAVISREADLLKIYYTVYYDPLVINANGELIANTAVKPVEVAINGYIQNLPFDGKLNLTKLTDAIQNMEGVVDPLLQNAYAKYGSLDYALIVNNYNADAGHMKIDDAFPLSVTITYIANV